MKKFSRLFHFLFAFLMLCFSFYALPAKAHNEKFIHGMANNETEILPRFYDGAGLVSDNEEKELCKKLDEISERRSFDIIVCTVDRLPQNYNSIVNFADDYFDYNDFGHGTMDRNGCLLVINMDTRDWYICTTGYGKTVFTDWGIQYIGDKIKEAGLSDGDYYEAFIEFINQCDDFIEQAEHGRPYDSNNQPPMDKEKALTIGIVCGIIIGFIVVLVMLACMRTVAKKTEAGYYVVDNSLQIDYANDVFLYSTVTKTKRETDSDSGGGSSTHTGSSGVSHGGGGGKF